MYYNLLNVSKNIKFYQMLQNIVFKMESSLNRMVINNLCN